MTTYIARRLLQALVVLVIVTLLVFFVMRLLPGDPLIIYLAQSADLEAMPPTAMDDALHVAVCAVHGIDYLPTWNVTVQVPGCHQVS